MIKHRLMLSAAAAVLLALPAGVNADTEVSTSTDTALTTTTGGNITIDSTGSISVNNGGAVISLDSNNSVTNNGLLSQGNSNNALGIQIDTSGGNIVAPGLGLVSTNTITLGNDGGINRVGVLVTGGNHYYGGITINNVTGVNLNGAGATINIQGDGSSAFRQTAGTTITGDVIFGGSFTTAPNQKSTGVPAGTMFSFAAPVYGNVAFDSTSVTSNIGASAIGISILAPIHACADDTTAAAAGFTCSTAPTSGLGVLVNAGKIVTVGQAFIDPTSKDPVLEGGSVLVIGSSIDGGVYNAGPYTGNSGIATAAFSGNGAGGQAVVYIDPTASGLGAPINIGPISSALDVVDPGYSFINRGTIVATPAVDQLDSAAMFIQGGAPTVYTCLGNGDFNSCGSDGKGGLLNSGTISASSTTNATGLVTTNVSATALAIGPYANIPRIDVTAEATALGATTTGIINATVSGTSGGIATAITIGQGAMVPRIDVGQNAQILASVSTSNLNPTTDVGTASAPFTLVATAISDGSSSLKTINNAGTIAAAITTVTPAVGATVLTSVRAIDLTSSTLNGITINNSGQILGDLLFGAGGNNYTLNVGNINGAANPANAPLVSNSPNNYAIVADAIDSQTAGATPITEVNVINFGAGSGHVLDVGAFGYVNSIIKSNPGALAVKVENNGVLFIANTTNSVNASTFDINGGTLGLTISQNTTATTPVIRATSEATILANSTVAMQFGSFVSSGTTLATVTNPITQNIVLITAPIINIDPNTLLANNATLSQNLPFLFQPSATPLSVGSANGNQTLVLSLTPRVPGKGSGKADDTSASDIAGLGLSGDALAQFPYVASALGTDPTLGAAIATNLTVYNRPGDPTSKINIAASQQQALNTFSQFGPDTSGGARQVAILITDQASGPVAARQRMLRSYGRVAGDLTLWGTEFVGNINNKGRVDADQTLTDYKDHGFGFSMGLDSGSPRGGWYGGAFTFYSGDVTQTLPRDSKTHTQWYMLTGYTDWQGGHLFLDTQLSAAYGNLKGLRDLVVGNQAREATGKRAALMAALGGNLGANFHAGPIEISPHFSLDGLTLREEGYTETGGGNGFDLQVAPYYANSLRGAFGTDINTSVNMFGFTFSPQLRFGYRYDMVNSPVKLKAGFIGTGGVDTAGNSMTFVGPDPDTGNLIGGLGLNAGTDTWHLGVNYDYLRGNNGSVSQVGTITLLGRI